MLANIQCNIVELILHEILALDFNLFSYENFLFLNLLNFSKAPFVTSMSRLMSVSHFTSSFQLYKYRYLLNFGTSNLAYTDRRYAYSYYVVIPFEQWRHRWLWQDTFQTIPDSFKCTARSLLTKIHSLCLWLYFKILICCWKREFFRSVINDLNRAVIIWEIRTFYLP